MAGWTCADCGTPGAYPVEDDKFGVFSKFDDRYTTGYCDSCTVRYPKTPRKGPRRTSRLIRSDDFDLEAFQTNKEKARLRGLIQRLSGAAHIEMAEKDRLDLVRLYDKHGMPGFHLPDWVRKP